MNAQGSITRSRITGVDVDESATGFTVPGGFRSNPFGFGIAHVGRSHALTIDGDCQASGGDTPIPPPLPLATGPLFGQDGVRVSGGAAVRMVAALPQVANRPVHPSGGRPDLPTDGDRPQR